VLSLFEVSQDIPISAGTWLHVGIILETGMRPYCFPKPLGLGPVQVYYRLTEFQEVEASIFIDIRHLKVVRLLALLTGRLYLSRPQGHSAAGRM
jgi:hypothetical protein